MKKLFVVISVLLLMLLAVPAVAHVNDGSSPCDGNGDMILVVFDGANLTGANDDFCFSNVQINHDSGDPNFSSNEGWLADDVGDRYLMNGFVSSLSLNNTTPWTFRVGLYPDPNYGGIPYCISLSAGEHRHFNVAPIYNNTIDSAYFWSNEWCG